jgi:hypothetical protein
MQTVTGRIIDGTTAKPIESVRITLVGDTLAPLTVRTDARGRFSLTALVPTGRYSIQMSAPGYVSFDDNRTNFDANTEDHDVGDLALRRVAKQEDFEADQPDDR